ncbi:hypothetical protein AALP_AA7G070100 [Arabis alpina]|uniref:Uncharacterized protein n=1 Tax=Arabis alpina TaxID=50452 RepID=A0A087GGF2_ARAAL|nr:hypothetical protein AALP_AA7G070100 [Arabis alpina]
MSDRLGLVATIKDRANEIFKKLRIKSQAGERIRMHFWQLAYTFHVDKRTSRKLLRAKRRLDQLL